MYYCAPLDYSTNVNSLELIYVRKTLGSISHCHCGLDNSKLEFVWPISQVKRHGMVYFWICVFFKVFLFQHHIHKKILNIFFTNLHPICLQLNFNPIVQLKWIEIKFSWSGLQLNCNVVHTSISYMNELKVIKKHFHQDIYLFFIFFYVFSLGASKVDLLHVIPCIISSLPFG